MTVDIKEVEARIFELRAALVRFGLSGQLGIVFSEKETWLINEASDSSAPVKFLGGVELIEMEKIEKAFRYETKYWRHLERDHSGWQAVDLDEHVVMRGE